MEKKVLLLSPYADLTSYGLRSISASLKKNGIDTIMVFLADQGGTCSDSGRTAGFYKEETIKEIAELSKNCIYIGISLMSCFFERIKNLTLRLKDYTDIPVIWGGIHTFIDWEESSGIADFVVAGDGEKVSVELAGLLSVKSRDYLENSDISGINNLIFRKNGKLYKSAVLGAVIEDLDSIPVPDIDLENKFIMINSRIKELTREIFYHYQISNPLFGLKKEVYYQTLSSRGCPHSCTYCSNNILKRLSRGKYLRFRSPEHLIKELKMAKEIYTGVSCVVFSDDSFISMPQGKIHEFASLYKRHIGLPFRCLVSPATIDEGKLRILLDSGLKSIQMGIESGSPETLRLYKRAGNVEGIIKAVNILNRYRDNFDPPVYDLIVDNPFESLKNRKETLDLVLSLPKPFKIQLFSLILFPKTELYDKYIEENMHNHRSIDIKNRQFYEIEPDYINILLILAKRDFPVPIITFLASGFFIRLFSLRPVNYILIRLASTLRRLKALFCRRGEPRL